MGRKKTGTSNDSYFSEKEELAIIKYNNATSIEEKNIVFSQEIYKPLKKLVHKICERYGTGTGMYSKAEFETMALSHTFEQIPKFNPNKPNELGILPKAFSYLGTVCRHYATNFGKKSSKEKLVNNSIEDYKIDYDEIDENNKGNYLLQTYEMHGNNEFDMHEILLNKICVEIKNTIELTTELTFNEIKIGEALIMIFENWKSISETYEIEKLSNFFAKKKIHQIIKDITNLETKEIKFAFDIYMDIYRNKFIEVYNELDEIDNFNS